MSTGHCSRAWTNKYILKCGWFLRWLLWYSILDFTSTGLSYRLLFCLLSKSTLKHEWWAKLWNSFPLNTILVLPSHHILAQSQVLKIMWNIFWLWIRKCRLRIFNHFYLCILCVLHGRSGILKFYKRDNISQEFRQKNYSFL